MLVALAALIDGYINNCQRYIHGHSTIQLESLNGTACKQVNKDCNWTVMYVLLFDAGILECNEGKESAILVDLFKHIRLDVSYAEERQWLKVLMVWKK
ncbi:uncharacterized protein ACA1_093660 [Acanthamoeba castellanii str. Neff]|uniref:Uncharacterized protein n=1 Tax=Acanthamoeba castellanii (strain ATCC 30010 / Neff) TaxID=1257118 RepID=L8GIA5_ACACF|nr:uncharacterized protein ACA1_093660 [Acanthamoeba castellanii str. Neff]ELR12820.1 hypothetical protein ACA1_093660 [Acanthamoeba castellanii str. Neff]